MEIVVIWSDSAIEELRCIYDYLYFQASKRVADKTSNAIVDKTLLLEQTPRVGQKEGLLTHLNKEIRYLESAEKLEDEKMTSERSDVYRK